MWAVVADDLSAPLGQHRTSTARRALPIGVPRLVAGLLGLSIAVFAGWAMVVDDPFGGEPMVIVSAEQPEPGRKSEEAFSRSIASDPPARPNRYDGPQPEAAQASTIPA